jgi:hypothetical protein
MMPASLVINARLFVSRAQKLGVRYPDVAPSPSAPARLRFNTHSGGPRLPQTPAASFKRLYRE